MKKYILYSLIIFTALQIFVGTPNTTKAVTCDDNGGPVGCTPVENEECTPDDNGNVPEKCKVYHLLEPIPCPDGTPGCTDGTGILKEFDAAGDPNDNSTLANYLNLMIKIFIGLCGVLAVLMIVIGGIEYITSDLITSKETARSRMMHAVQGLLLALAAYAILNTINPHLLDLTFDSFKGVKVSVTYQADDNDEFDPYPTTATIPSTAAGCPSGVARSTINPGFVACKDILARFESFLYDAQHSKPPLVITGGGFRSQEEQIELRRKNCNGNITDPNAKCTPATAVPGFSEHESGRAFDLKCNGKQMTTSDPCYALLQKNSSLYGLKNLPGEPWHWSVSGK